jgi:hypothetical protein
MVDGLRVLGARLARNGALHQAVVSLTLGQGSSFPLRSPLRFRAWRRLPPEGLSPRRPQREGVEPACEHQSAGCKVETTVTQIGAWFDKNAPSRRAE